MHGRQLPDIYAASYTIPDTHRPNCRCQTRSIANAGDAVLKQFLPPSSAWCLTRTPDPMLKKQR